MDYTQQNDESFNDYMKRIKKECDRSTNNIKKIKEDMIRDGVIGFCEKCGCHIYKDKIHKC